jgi:hypothetical protein
MMSYDAGPAAANGSFAVDIYFVTDSQNEAVLLAKRLLGLAQRVAVNWVSGDQRAVATIEQALKTRGASAPSAIILDYASLGKRLWSIFKALRRAIGDRYVEYVVFDLPSEECQRPELRAANVTTMPVDLSFCRDCSSTEACTLYH